MTTQWKSFWDTYRFDGTISEETMFEQVGRTVHGKPVSDQDFKASVEFVVDTLELGASDVLLEYCCGNGLVTYELSKIVREVFAFDFTPHLIEAARRFRSRPNVHYWVGDALEPLPAYVGESKANKCQMSFALAHFDCTGLERILDNLSAVLEPTSFLLTGIPDIEKQHDFYNTPERAERFQQLRERGDVIHDGIGRWWSRSEISRISLTRGYEATFFAEPGPSNHFRMAALLRSSGAR